MKRIVIGDFPQVQSWMSDRFNQAPQRAAQNVVLLNDDGSIRGACWLENYNGASAVIHVAGEGKGWVTRAFLRTVFHYAFVVLGCKKLIGSVRSVNIDAQLFDEGLGFKRECVIEDADPCGDLIIYSLKREDCKYLRGKHGQA